MYAKNCTLSVSGLALLPMGLGIHGALPVRPQEEYFMTNLYLYLPPSLEQV